MHVDPISNIMMANYLIYLNFRLHSHFFVLCLQVYSVPIGGMMVRQPVSVGGSGSSYIYGFMDSNYKPGMTQEQCMELTAAGTHCCCRPC